ncbi:unnamed protein product, partial [marine sediment metagenome]
MAKMKKIKNKKGLLFTLAIFLIVTTVLSLALLIFNHYKSNIDRTAELSSLDRFSDLSGSI